jgi:peptide-methionine (S)-S-oxide reductase
MLRIVAAVIALAALLALATSPRAQDTPAPREGVAVATFGSGCFWCTEADFDKVPGVLTTTSGYMGGKTPNPSYEQVSTGRTGHAEVLQLTYDPSKVTYQQLLDHYWRTTDVLDGTGQFCDRGSQYRPVIFTHTPEQLKLATEAKAALQTSGRFDKPAAVEIVPATAFTAAEDYHQEYYKKNPLRYKFYRHGCGREARLEALWGAEAGK